MLCIVVPSMNNMPNNRYKLVFDSIARQHYPTHLLSIVFIDDSSLDTTYESTKLYVQEQYPHLNDRTVYIRN